MAARPRSVNVKSRYLTDVENDAVFVALGRGCLTLATTVGELYYSADEKKETWDRQYSCVVCLVKDNLKRSYFIRCFDRKNQKMELVWEHDLRKARSDVFSCVFSRNKSWSSLTIHDRKRIFLETDEAEHFQKEIDNTMSRLKERRSRRQGSTNTIDVGSAPSGGDAETYVQRRHKPNKPQEKLTKDKIGKPTHFRHVSRVSWDPNVGLNLKELDPDLCALLENIGIKDKDQKQIDKETLDFIYDFIDNNGGIKAVANDIARGQDESTTKHREQKLPRTVGNQRVGPPPPPPVMNQKLLPPPPPNRTTPIQPNRNQCVPPPLPGKTKTRPPPPQMNQRMTPLPPPSKNQGVPPPPPPPGRNQGVPPPPPGRNQGVPPPPPGRNQGVPPPPPGRNQGVPPPPPGKTKSRPAPPRTSSNQELPPQTPSDRTKQPSLQDIGGAAAYQDNPLKQQIMQLLLQNPAQITEFIYGIVDKRGGIDFIKDNLTEPNTQTYSNNEVDDDTNSGVTDNQVSDRTSNSIQASGTMSSADEVVGRSVPGSTNRFSRDFELSSDVFDGDDDEWDDVTDQD